MSMMLSSAIPFGGAAEVFAPAGLGPARESSGQVRALQRQSQVLGDPAAEVGGLVQPNASPNSLTGVCPSRFEGHPGATIRSESKTPHSDDRCWNILKVRKLFADRLHARRQRSCNYGRSSD
jgi:hypothetical protein